MGLNGRNILTITASTPPAADGDGGSGTGNQEDGLVVLLDANDEDSHDGDSDTTWYDISDHEFTPAVNPEEHFNTVTYSGNNADNSINGVGFEPDFIWFKDKGGTYAHSVFDSLRGVNDFIRTNSTSENSTSSSTQDLKSFDADGFTLGTSYHDTVNKDGRNYVAWCLKAGGKPDATNTETSGAMTDDSVSIDGTLQSSYTPSGSPDIYPHKMSVNTELGFSIVTYRGTSTDYDKYPHGLGQRPDLIITKSYAGGAIGGWNVTAIGVTDDFKELRLDVTDDLDTVSTRRVDHSAVDANVVTLGTSGFTNSNNDDYVAYHFVSKRGVSKVGTYKGTGTSGNKIYTGFEPAWVMIKNTTSDSSNWMIYDIKRDADGTINKYLEANTSDEEATASTATVSPNADGFTLGNSNSVHLNKSGNTFIYLAFAKNTNETQLTPNKGDFVAEDTVTSGAELEFDANDYSGSGNWLNTGNASSSDGTITGASYVPDGTSDYFSFDGNDYITSSSSGLTANTYTIEAWFYIDTLDTAGIVSWGDQGSNYERRSMIIWNQGGSNYYLFSSTYSSNIRGNTALETGRWYHGVVTMDNGSANIYLNGEHDGSGTNTLSAYTSSTLYIGRTAEASEIFDGNIAIARVYDTVLTSAQIKANYDATYGLYQHADLEVHLDAGDDSSYSGSGSTWSDLANSNDATITGASYDQELGDFFDFGDDLDELTWSATTSLGTNRTAEMWVNFDNFDTQYLFDATPHYQPQNSFGSYALYVNGNDIIGSSNKWNGSTYAAIKIANPMTVGKWHHIVYTVDGSTNKIYIDGEEQSRVTDSYYIDRAAVSVSLNNLVFGNLRDTATNHAAGTYSFNGKLGQFRIYNSTLTESQIRQNYNFTKNDYPNGYHMTITNATYNSGGYFNFDGTGDYMQNNDLAGYFNKRNEFAVSVWFKSSHTGSSGQAIWSFSDNTAGSTECVCQLRSNQIQCYNRINGSHSAGPNFYAGSGMGNNAWHHVVYQGDSTGTKIYIDNTEITNRNFDDSTNSSDVVSFEGMNRFSIGGNDDSSSGLEANFNGQISKLRVYNRTLTTNEIETIFNEGE